MTEPAVDHHLDLPRLSIVAAGVDGVLNPDDPYEYDAIIVDRDRSEEWGPGVAVARIGRDHGRFPWEQGYDFDQHRSPDRHAGAAGPPS
jgi:hypothetical protein